MREEPVKKDSIFEPIEEINEDKIYNEISKFHQDIHK